MKREGASQSATMRGGCAQSVKQKFSRLHRSRADLTALYPMGSLKPLKGFREKLFPSAGRGLSIRRRVKPPPAL
jgi:hypothetical protein